MTTEELIRIILKKEKQIEALQSKLFAQNICDNIYDLGEK